MKVTISPDFGLRFIVAVASLSVHFSSSAVVDDDTAVSARNKAEAVLQERPMFARRVADGTIMLLRLPWSVDVVFVDDQACTCT